MKILILYNARSGGHKRLNFTAYLNALSERGAYCETRTLGRSFKVEELIKDVNRFDRLVVAGGDGTVSHVAGLLQNSGIPIVAYPGGTANLLALNLGMPATPETLADVTLNGKTVAIDLGELDYIRYSAGDLLKRRFLKRFPQKSPPAPIKIYFSIMAGCGVIARMVSQALPLKSRWGPAAYWLSAFLNLFPRPATLTLKLDGKEIHTKGIGILVINFAKIQFDLKIVSDGHAADGKFEVVVLKPRSLFGLIPVLWEAIRERLGFPRYHVPEVMETYQASELEVICKPPLRLQFDGEVIKKAAEFKITIHPRATVFVTQNAVN